MEGSAGSAPVSGEELVARARVLVPALRARAAAAEEAGRIPEKTIEDIRDAGLFRAVVPRRYGGHEIEFRHVPQIFRELGRGCTSTAWTMGFLIYHNFQFGHFPAAAQDEVWGARGYTMAPGQVMPSGRAVPAEGGYELTGRWGYATGIQHGDWMLLSAPVVAEDAGAKPDGPPDLRRFFVPVEQFTILDTWHVAAMRATGSHDVTLDRVFVPAHRQIKVSELRAGAAPGLALNTGPLWRVPLLTLMVSGAVGPLLGAAEAVFELVAEAIKSKTGAYTGVELSRQMSTRIGLAENKMRLDAVRGFFDARIAFVDETVATGGTLSLEQRAETRMAIAHVARESHAIVNNLAKMAGSRAYYLDSPIQRFQRDVNCLATHAIFDFDSLGDLHGGVLTGHGLPPDAMI
jgi:alkylation response protein AidB-like acyl-CoA dehydrogenase